MQPRSLQQVLSELDSVYNPQIDSLRTRQAAIPGQIQAEEQGLQAKQETAFGDILNGARRRGMGFSGIPLGEQAKYTATEFLPALARMKQSAREQAMSLEDAILGINERRNAQGQNIFQFESQAAEQRRQFDENLRLQREQMAASQRAAAQAAAAASPSYWYGAGGGQGAGPSLVEQRADKGFNFRDQAGRPISAAAYAAATGTPFREVLTRMAKAGDKGAQQALGFVGNDFGYDKRKVNTQSTAKLYNDLTWGMGRPQAQAAPYAQGPARPAASAPRPAPAPARPAGMMSTLPFSSLVGRR